MDKLAPIDLGVPGLEPGVEIGRGGFGIVYRAFQPKLNRTVAVKVLLGAQLSSADSERFLREIRGMGTVSGHPGIVTIFEGGATQDGRQYILMEYMAGGSLRDHIANRGPLAWFPAMGLALDLGHALGFAHSAHLLHRDLKPGNVLVSAWGHAKIADFGIARLRGVDQTRSTLMHFSVAHAPPEILEDRPPTQASDVYSLASTILTVMLGRPPFVAAAGEPIAATLGRILKGEQPDLSQVGCPAAIGDLLLRSLARNPAERPRDGIAFSEALVGSAAECGLDLFQAREQAYGRLRVLQADTVPTIEPPVVSDAGPDDPKQLDERTGEATVWMGREHDQPRAPVRIRQTTAPAEADRREPSGAPDEPSGDRATLAAGRVPSEPGRAGVDHYCLACGASVEDKAQRCPKCGLLVRGGLSAPAVDELQRMLESNDAIDLRELMSLFGAESSASVLAGVLRRCSDDRVFRRVVAEAVDQRDLSSISQALGDEISWRGEICNACGAQLDSRSRHCACGAQRVPGAPTAVEGGEELVEYWSGFRPKGSTVAAGTGPRSRVKRIVRLILGP
jgi:hypothetical protein